MTDVRWLKRGTDAVLQTYKMVGTNQWGHAVFDWVDAESVKEMEAIAVDLGLPSDALLAQRIEHKPSKLGVEGSNPSERASLRDDLARAIWAVKPDCQGKRFPTDRWSEKDRRAYPHNPIASLDLCLIYADAAIAVIERLRAQEVTVP